jgi:phage protein U
MSLGVLDSGDSATRITFAVTKDQVLTWQELRRRGAARWAQHEVHAGKPKQEFQGPGLESSDLEVRLDRALGVDPGGELEKMRQVRDAGVVLQFTVGGKLIGDFVLKEVDEDHKRHGRKGELITAVARLALEEYA